MGQKETKNLNQYVIVECTHLQIPHPRGDTVTVRCTHLQPPHPKGDTVTIPCAHLRIPHPKGHSVTVRCTHLQIPHPRGDTVTVRCTHLQPPHPKGHSVTVPCKHRVLQHPKGHIKFGMRVPCVHFKARHPRGDKLARPCTHRAVPKHPKGHNMQRPCTHNPVPKHPKGDKIVKRCVHRLVPDHPKGHNMQRPCTHNPVPKHPKGDKIVERCIHNPVPKHPKGDRIKINNGDYGKFPILSYYMLKKDSSLWQALLDSRLDPKYNKDIEEKIMENIYFVNGVRTEGDQAGTNNDNLKGYLNNQIKSFTHPNSNCEVKTNMYSGTINGGYKVRLVYNPTAGPISDFKEALEDKLWSSPQPITNPTTIAVIALLHKAMAKNCFIGLVGHSQGSIIISNAIIAFSKLGSKNKTYLKGKVKVCVVGLATAALTGHTLHKLVNRYFEIANTKDVIAQYVGTRIIHNRELEMIDNAAHCFESYLNYRSEDVFPKDFFTDKNPIARQNMHKSIDL